MSAWINTIILPCGHNQPYFHELCRYAIVPIKRHFDVIAATLALAIASMQAVTTTPRRDEEIISTLVATVARIGYDRLHPLQEHVIKKLVCTQQHNNAHCRWSVRSQIATMKSNPELPQSASIFL